MRGIEREKSLEKSKDRCMNCEWYNWTYGYCSNKKSVMNQREVRFDETCASHEKGGRWA